MGYTNYWYILKNDDKAYNNFKNDAHKLIEYAVREKVIDTNGITVDDDRILFHGPCESFFWPKDAFKYRMDLGINDEGAFFFCKTNRYEYDKVICALLIRAKFYYKDNVKVMSDGEWGLDWLEGRKLYKETFGADGPDNVVD